MNVNNLKICLLDCVPHVQIETAIVHRESVPVVKRLKRMAVIQRVTLGTLHATHPSVRFLERELRSFTVLGAHFIAPWIMASYNLKN